MNNFGFVRVAAISPVVHVGNVEANVQEIIKALNKTTADVVVFPELSLTGYTCGDLFGQTKLLDAAVVGLVKVMHVIKNKLVVVGMPIRANNTLYNCAVALYNSKVLGVVPKQHIPNYGEFYEKRWFHGANGNEPKSISLFGQDVPFGVDLLFCPCDAKSAVIGIELCEDLWTIIPPSSYQAIAGANILCNLSASNEVVGKGEYRSSLVEQQSGRCIAAYIYACASPTESTSDIVMAGDCIIAENGSVLKRTKMLNTTSIIEVDIDVEKLQNERRKTTSFADFEANSYRYINFGYFDSHDELNRHIDAHPFVPADNAQLNERCETIFNIQKLALQKRWNQIGCQPMYLGLSGGLDSTWAFLVAKTASVNVNLLPCPVSAPLTKLWKMLIN